MRSFESYSWIATGVDGGEGVENAVFRNRNNWSNSDRKFWQYKFRLIRKLSHLPPNPPLYIPI